MNPNEPKRWPPVGIACDEIALLSNVTGEIRNRQRQVREAYPQGYREKAPPYRQYLRPEFIAELDAAMVKRSQRRSAPSDKPTK